MEVGDSFYLAKAGSADERTIANLRAWGLNQKPRRQFMARQQPEGGVRVWRIK